MAYGVWALNPRGLEQRKTAWLDSTNLQPNNSVGEATSLLAYGSEILGIKRKSDVRPDFET